MGKSKLDPSYGSSHLNHNFVNPLLTLNAPIATKFVRFSRLLKCLRSLYGKQCGTRLDCSYRSSLFWVHAVCFYTLFVSNVRQLFAADDFSRRHFQIHSFLGTLRVKVGTGIIPSVIKIQIYIARWHIIQNYSPPDV